MEIDRNKIEAAARALALIIPFAATVAVLAVGCAFLWSAI